MHLDTSKIKRCGWKPRRNSDESIRLAIRQLVKEILTRQGRNGQKVMVNSDLQNLDHAVGCCFMEYALVHDWARGTIHDRGPLGVVPGLFPAFSKLDLRAGKDELK